MYNLLTGPSNGALWVALPTSCFLHFLRSFGVIILFICLWCSLGFALPFVSLFSFLCGALWVLHCPLILLFICLCMVFCSSYYSAVALYCHLHVSVCRLVYLWLCGRIETKWLLWGSTSMNECECTYVCMCSLNYTISPLHSHEWEACDEWVKNELCGVMLPLSDVSERYA